MKELKPCPFCGQEVTLKSTSATKSFVISHKGLRNCAFYKFEIPWETGESLKNATTLWNRRAEPLQIVNNGEMTIDMRK